MADVPWDTIDAEEERRRMYSAMLDADDEARKLLRDADAGDVKARMTLSRRFQVGAGVRKNAAVAFLHLRICAERGDVGAQYEMATFFREGESVVQNYAEAFRFYLMAAQQGMALAQTRVAFAYDIGRGVAQSGEDALYWWRLSAAQGNGNALYNLGVAYRDAHGVARDYDAALRFFKQSAKTGSSLAFLNVGDMYYNARGVEVDVAKAVRCWRLGARCMDSGVEKVKDVLRIEQERGTLARVDAAETQRYRALIFTWEALVESGTTLGSLPSDMVRVIIDVAMHKSARLRPGEHVGAFRHIKIDLVRFWRSQYANIEGGLNHHAQIIMQESARRRVILENCRAIGLHPAMDFPRRIAEAEAGRAHARAELLRLRQCLVQFEDASAARAEKRVRDEDGATAKRGRLCHVS
jgi:TPR repeat protein